MVNGAVSLFVGVYLLAVLWGGNEGKLFSLVSEEKGFIKWAGALITLAYLSRISGGKLGELISSFGALALLALLLGNGEKIFGGFSDIYGSEKK